MIYTVYLPIPDALLVLSLIFVSPVLCAAATHLTLRHERRVLERREKAADERDVAQDARDDKLGVRELNVTDREEVVVGREQGLVRRAKEVEAAVASSAAEYDTQVSVVDAWPDLPHPNQDDPTVSMPIAIDNHDGTYRYVSGEVETREIPPVQE